MKRILVPVDFSEEAKCAVKTAANLARKTNSEVFLLHMVDLPEGIIDAQSGTDNSSPASILYLKKIHERFEEIKNSPELEGLTVHEKVQFQKTFDGVIEESKTDNIDLIVMGSSGASGIKEIIIGSNTEKVVRHSNVPVLVVKKGHSALQINHIVFASDFVDDSKNRFQDVIDFAKIFDATLHLLYVNTPHNFNTTKDINERISNFVDDFTLDKFDITIYNDISVEKGILNYANDIDADLIALNTHGRSGLSQLFNGSIGQELANHALKPVLTFKI